MTTPQQREEQQGRHEQERAWRPDASNTPSVGLVYSKLYELIATAEKNWDKVPAALGKRAAILPLLEHFERIRNTASQSRELVHSERELVPKHE